MRFARKTERVGEWERESVQKGDKNYAQKAKIKVKSVQVLAVADELESTLL